MTASSLTFDARLARSAFALQERIPLTLTVTNTGAARELVPDPTRGGDSIELRLQKPSGAVVVFRPSDAPPTPGVRAMLANAAVLPRETTTFHFDVSKHFELTEVGDYSLVVDYVWAPNERFRSANLPFRIAAAAGTFLDVTPNEATGAGYYGVLWSEAEPGAARGLLFDYGRRNRVLQGAEPAVALPLGAEPALSMAPAEQPNPERWIAWIDANTLQAIHFTHGDAATAITARPLPLPGTAGAPRLVRPLLAENAPDELRPRCAVGVLAENLQGGKDLHLVEIDGAGGMAIQAVVPMASAVVEGWATAPTDKDRLFVFAMESPGWVHVIAISAPWDGACAAPVAWFAAPADGYLAGDVRAQSNGRVRVGVLLRRGVEWVRITFTAPAPGEQDATSLVTESVRLPPDAEPVRLTLDAEGRAHLLYRRGKEIHYLQPGASVPSWTSDRLGSKAPQTARLVLRPGRPPMLVVYHADLGATLGRV